MASVLSASLPRVALTLWAGLAGCGARMPSAVRLPDAAPVAASDPVSDRTSALAATLRGDPLARRPSFPPDEALRDLEGARALAATAAEIARLERNREDQAEGLALHETRWPRTEAVALSRGYRLGMAERRIAQAGSAGPASLNVLATWLTPLRPAPAEVGIARHPLHAWSPRPDALPDLLRAAAERWVLVSWLDGPDIPLAPVASALEQTAYDALRDARVGKLILARAEGRSAAGGVEDALRDLHLATELALIEVAADRASEQGRWSDRRRAEAERLGADDPTRALLERAFEGLLADAGDPEAAGAALLTSEALRLRDACDAPPCRGLLDRTASLRRPLAWSAALAPLVSAWQVVSLKRALDGLEVGRDTIRYPEALAEMVDALVGTGGAPVREDVLVPSQPDPTVWAALAASVGEEGAASWEDVRIAIGQHLAEVTRRARDRAPSSWHEPLDRILRRAVP